MASMSKNTKNGHEDKKIMKKIEEKELLRKVELEPKSGQMAKNKKGERMHPPTPW